MRAAIKMDEHTIPIEDLYARWNIDPEIGLTSKQVLKLQDGGNNLNQLTPPKEMSEIMKLLHTQTGPFNLLLWAGAILCFIGYGLQQSVDNLYLGIVLTTVVTITGIFEYLQERNASSLMNKFKNMLPPKALVNRNGQGFQPLDSLQLCCGDMVRIKAGQKIPADIRVISASDDMTVEQSVRPSNVVFFVDAVFAIALLFCFFFGVAKKTTTTTKRCCFLLLLELCMNPFNHLFLFF